MFRFDISISYAGEEAGIAEDLYRLLTEKGAMVFFDRSRKGSLLGKRLSPELRNVLGPDTRFFVLIVSENYVEKYWTLYEFEIAREKEAERRFEFILPIRLDNVNLEGLEDDRVYLDLRKEGLFRVADILM